MTITPQSLPDALENRPATIQEKWFANLYFLKPIIFVVFALFWIGTGLIALGPGWDIGMEAMRRGGVTGAPAEAAIIAGAVADILIGLAIAYKPTSKYGLYAAIGLSLTYVVVGTILDPSLWADPLGPMLKIWPILALNLVALAIADDR